MEEKEKNQKKLTYEQLEAYTNQTVTQAQKLAEEYEKLREAYKQLVSERGIAEMNLALKCLEHKDLFSPEFIKSIVSRIEESLSPVEEDSKEA